VDRFRRLVEPDPPGNFLWCYSHGGNGFADENGQRLSMALGGSR
jgi:hypothetical protein